MRPALLLLLAVLGHAASAEEVIAAAEATLSDLDRETPGPARAEALAAAVAANPGLPAAGLLAVQLAIAEAWLDGGRPDRCAAIAAAVQGDAAAAPAQRERAALARAAAARALLRAGDAPGAGAVLDALEAAGDAGRLAAAHRAVARAELALALDGERRAADAPAALVHLDMALGLLIDRPAAERLPVYLLRLLAMERGGAPPGEVLAWITARAQGDPAAAQAAASAATAADRMVGQPAPALAANRLDAAGGRLDLADLRGRPVLIDFFATWCGPCAAIAPAIARFAERHPQVQVLSVSLDGEQTIADLPAFAARHAMTWPIIGEGHGWDGELHKAWGVDAIPALFLVGAGGEIAATGLVGATPEETLAKLEAAVAALGGAAPAPAPPPAAAPAPFP